MSAYVVHPEHIRFLVEAGRSKRLAADQHAGPIRWVTRSGTSYWCHDFQQTDHARALEIGQMLLAENVKSVMHRYDDCDGSPDSLPGPCDWDYTYPKHASYCGCEHLMTPARVFQACDGYEYQSCEHDGWDTSEAKAYIEALQSRAMRCVIAETKDVSPWCIDKPLDGNPIF